MILSQTIEIDMKKLAEVVALAKNGKRASEQVKFLRSANEDAMLSLSKADSIIAQLDSAYFKMEYAVDIGSKIILEYEGIAEEGNRLVFTSVVGIGTYIVFDGTPNEKAVVFGMMAGTYLATRIFGAPFDLFKIDLNFWSKE